MEVIKVLITDALTFYAEINSASPGLRPSTA